MIFAILLAAAAAATPNCEPAWTYQNQAAWGGHCPDRQLNQSPINISEHAVDDPELKPIEFHYGEFPLSVLNTSRYFEVPDAKRCTITVDGHDYELEQFHFHVPAEHTGGAGHAAEMHLVHKYGTKTVVVGVLFAEQTRANVELEPIVKLTKLAAKCKTAHSREMIAPEELLPQNRSYTKYEGSLTTPGCDPDVTFYMMRAPVSASPEQIRALGAIGPSARDPQPLHDRVPKRSVH